VWQRIDADTDNYYIQSDCVTEVDCDDDDPNVYPNATEISDDNKDNDCDGYTDEEGAVDNFYHFFPP
jgi:hypothetical protein